MKGIKITMYVGAALFGIYALVNVVLNSISYSAYIDYYGLGQVLPAILEGFFTYAGWAFVLLALGALCGTIPAKLQPEEAIEAPEESAEESAAADETLAVAEDAAESAESCDPAGNPEK